MVLNLCNFIQDICRHRFEIHNVIVRQHGDIVGRFDWRASARDNIYSASKSITALAVGMAIDEGILRLDERPAEIFADFLPANPSENLLNGTLRDALLMAAGHDDYILPVISNDPANPPRDEIDTVDWVTHALSFDVPYTPGTHWKYGNYGSYLSSVIIQDRTGMTLRDYLMPRLFKPLGIKNPQWFQSPQGYSIGCAGLHLTPDELSRIGQLLLDEGRYDGRQLVSANWIREASSNLISNYTDSTKRDPDRSAGYGYMFWRCARDNAYRAVGWAGQYIIVLPEQDACITIMSYDFHEQKLMDSVWNYIVPLLKENA